MMVNDKFKMTTSFLGSYQILNSLVNDVFNGGGSYSDLVSQHSYNPAYDAKGNLTGTNTSADPYFGATQNPLINILLPTRISKTTRLLGNVKADYEIIRGFDIIR